MDNKYELSSTASTQKSLEAIRNGVAGLNKHRQMLLNRTPHSGDWTTFPKDSITIRDIAYLSAATQHEFALLRGKTNDVLFHGIERHCNITDKLLDLLKTGKLRLIAHSHPDYGEIEPSPDDRTFLRYIGQRESIIISYITGLEKSFSANLFEDL